MKDEMAFLEFPREYHEKNTTILQRQSIEKKYRKMSNIFERQKMELMKANICKGFMVIALFAISYFFEKLIVPVDGMQYAIPPLAIAAIISGAAAAVKTGYGIYQYKKGQAKLESTIRPTYTIPTEIQQNLTQAQLQALEGLPAEQKQQFVENIQRAMQTGLRGLTQRGLGVAGVGGLVQQQMDAYRTLLGQDVAARQTNLGALAQARSTMAAFKEREFDINQFQRYLEDRAMAQAMIGAGTQNIAGGLGDITSVAGQYLLYGGKGKGKMAPAGQGFETRPESSYGFVEPTTTTEPSYGTEFVPTRKQGYSW